MKLKGYKSVFVAAGVIVAAFAFAQDTAVDKQVTVFLKGADLLQATQMLSQQTGLNFVVEPVKEGEAYAKINLSLKDVSAGEAIQYICQAAGAYAERNEAGVFVIRFGQQRPAAPTQTEQVKVKKVTKKALLMHADAASVIQLIRSPQNPVNPDSDFEQMAQSNNRLTNLMSGRLLDRGQAATVTTPFDSTGYPTVEDPTAPQRGGGGRGGGVGGGGQVGGFGGQGGLGGGQGGQGGFGGQGGLGGQNGGGGDFSSLQGGQGLVPTGTDSLGYDPTDNSIIFRGTDEAYQELLDLLELFDKAPQQVVIKVEFITTSDSLDKSLGIDWSYQRGGIFAGGRPGVFARNSDPIYLNFASGNISTRMRTLLQNGYGRTVNAPLIRTMNNQYASVTSFQSTTIFLNQTVVNNNTTTIVSNPQSITINTGLQVRPRINGDGTITMSLAPQLTDFGQVRTGPDGQQIPDQLGQFLTVTARVRDGETVALGGLTRKQDTFSEIRFPILGDLPIIGQLFRSRNSQSNHSELIIFVTPKIVADNESGINP